MLYHLSDIFVWMLASHWAIILLQSVLSQMTGHCKNHYGIGLGFCSKLLKRFSYYIHLRFGKSFHLTWIIYFFNGAFFKQFLWNLFELQGLFFENIFVWLLVLILTIGFLVYLILTGMSFGSINQYRTRPLFQAACEIITVHRSRI